MAANDKKLIEKLARALWDYDNADMDPQWRDSAWDDMGGSEKAEERVGYELRALALLPVVNAEKASAWDEGAAEYSVGDEDAFANSYRYAEGV